MRQKPSGRPASSEQIIKDIKRTTRKQYSAEEKIPDKDNGCSIGLPRQLSTLPLSPSRYSYKQT